MHLAVITFLFYPGSEPRKEHTFFSCAFLTSMGNNTLQSVFFFVCFSNLHLYHVRIRKKAFESKEVPLFTRIIAFLGKHEVQGAYILSIIFYVINGTSAILIYGLL